MITSVIAIGITIGAYLINLRVHRRWHWTLTSPLILTPVVLAFMLPLAGMSLENYAHSTRLLVWMIGPLTLALAVPVYQQRGYIRQWWLALLVGTAVSATTAVVSAVWLASVFELPAALEPSLVARSISLPFAFVLSDELAGSRDLTALFVVVSGLVGIVFGDIVLMVLRLRSAQARGATLGAIAQVAGVARAHDHSPPAGVMASLVMIFSGAFTVIIAPLLFRL